MGDVVVVYKLDRLGRSLKHLLEVVAQLGKMEVAIQSISDAIDTTTAQGRLFFNIAGSFAEFERDLIRERTHAGLAAARARGRNPRARRLLRRPRVARPGTAQRHDHRIHSDGARRAGPA